jgi:hypothetical protein
MQLHLIKQKDMMFLLWVLDSSIGFICLFNVYLMIEAIYVKPQFVSDCFLFNKIFFQNLLNASASTNYRDLDTLKRVKDIILINF